MTPEQYEDLQKKTKRYGQPYDDSVDRYLPLQEPLRTKRGAIAKRQPHIEKKAKSYWQAQCSFRKLNTQGRVDELQARVQSRDRSRDATYGKEYSSIARTLREEDARRANERRVLDEELKERWWRNPQTPFDEKLRADVRRAVVQKLASDNELRTGCIVVKETGLSEEWASQHGLTYKETPSLDNLVSGPLFAQMRGHWTVIGGQKAVTKRVRELENERTQRKIEKGRREEAARNEAEAAKKAQHARVLSHAKNADDWDLTGTWEVTCDELSDYSAVGQGDTLEMTIHRDTSGASIDDDSSDDELEDYSDEQEDEDEDDDEDEDQAPTARKSKPSSLAQGPRFYASFDFSLVEGIMRIFPQSTARKSGKGFKIEQSPTFQYVWRGRETGEGEIQIGSDNVVCQITFANHGTSFEGQFKCNFVGPVTIVGTKTANGNGRQGSSEYAWKDLSERSHEAERVNRWR